VGTINTQYGLRNYDTAMPTAAKRVPLLLAELNRLYPDPRCELSFDSPFQLLIATILSAQCTDVMVNRITPELFRRFPTPESFVRAEPGEIESIIKPTGFFQNKAKSIRNCCRMLIEKHNGRVPNTLDDLVQLPGVGRKTANVVLGDAFGIPGITVDTHCGRLSRRLGLTTLDDAVKVEFALMKLIPQREWTRFSHQLILHGRRVCSSRAPQCGNCTLAPICPKVGVETINPRHMKQIKTRIGNQS
jgi:endonuclease-3